MATDIVFPIDVASRHVADLAHHVRQAKAWLSASGEGEHTAAISYAALELRYAVERLAIQYWATLLNREVEEADLRDVRSFKSVERRIYELAGHQKEIDGHFAFMRIILEQLKIDLLLHTPQIGELSSYWHECSELCHIGWPLASTQLELRQHAFTKLTEIERSLETHATSLGWPVIEDQGLLELRSRFVAGEATADDIVAYLKQIGLWARQTFPDGRPSQFVGTSVPPRSPSSRS